MKEHVLSQLNSLGCRGRRLLVAVSGGLDSIVLLHLLQQSDNSLSVAHANFQLRGAESDGDEAFVVELAKHNNIPCYTRRFETNNYANQHGISIQMAARELRYDWFDELLDREKIDYLVTAHHLDDQMETVLLNFTRGTGLGGWLGIHPRKGRTLRPMLGVSRKEIEAFATKHSLPWREDSSNASDDYQRNFIRHHIIPRLRELNPSLEETFARNDERLRGAYELMIAGMNSISASLIVSDGPRIKLRKEVIASTEYPAAILVEFLKEYGFNLEQCRDMAEAMSGRPGKQFQSPSHRLVVDRDFLILTAVAGSDETVTIPAHATEVKRGRTGLRISSRSPHVSTDRNCAMLDKSKVTYPITWRRWRNGDSFYPLGLQHRKKLSDFLVNNKVPLNDKSDVTVLESGGEIMWVVGYRIDDRFKITSETKEAVAFELED